MLKLLGAIMVIAGTALCGYISVGKMKRRVKCLSSMAASLALMESEIADRLTPMPELLERLSDDAFYPASLVYRRTAEGLYRLGEMTFSELWGEALNAESALLISPEESEILRRLGMSLGKYSAYEQKKAIEYARRKMEEAAVKADAEREKNSRVQTALGLAAGIFTVIIFI